MLELSQAELDAVLLREWSRVRAAQVFGSMLPSAASRQWVRDDHAVGYVTLNYTVTPQAVIPDAQGPAHPGRATLLEHYWSVRTKDGRNDPAWPPSLNVHAVHAYAHPVTIADCDAALRNAIVLHRAALRAGDGCFEGQASARCYVRTLVLGPSIPDDVATLAAVEEVKGVSFVAACYRYSVAGGFEFELPADVDRFWRVGPLDVDAIREIGAQFFDRGTLPDQAYQWRGTNDGPVSERSAFPAGD